MNTEINFLEKKHKRSAASLVSGVLLIILLALMAATFFFQKNSYQTEIDQQQKVLLEIESALINHQAEQTGGIKLQRLQEIAELESGMPKNLSLYKKVTSFLDNPGQLVSYDSTDRQNLVINAQFAGLGHIAEYISSLGSQLYINDIQLTSVTKTGESYLTTLTISSDTQSLGKELAEND